MVSKVAVIALVAIVACPILLGYGMNLNEVTESDYRSSNDPVNVTQLLRTDTAYSYSIGNSYQNNTNFGLGGYTMPMMPIFNSIISTSTSFPMYQINYAPGTAYNMSMVFSQYADVFTYIIAEYNGGAGYLQMIIKDDSNVTQLTVNYLHTAFYNEEDGSVKYTYYAGGNLNNLTVGTYVIGNTNYILSLAKVGGDSTNVYLDLSRSVSNNYVDIASGYYFQSRDNEWVVKFPSNTRSVIMTVDLDSITDSSYSAYFSYQGINYKLTKTTTAGVVSWNIQDNINGWSQDLYYDDTISHNTYQFYFDFEKIAQDGSYKYYQSNAEFRYIGSWPTIIREANYYTKYSNTVELKTSISTPDYNMSYIDINGTSNNRSPTVRVDKTEFRAFEYMVIKDKTYTPSGFKDNPVTTISDITSYGKSITFGGTTYAVNKGNITIGTKSIPVNNLKFISIPNPNGFGYVNKIGNTEVSITGEPSKIVFNGEWAANVTTASMESYTYTKTEWEPGKFAWNGIDGNYITFSLLASIGAFIGVAIYSKMTNKSLWPLLIVCGGAVVLFFSML